MQCDTYLRIRYVSQCRKLWKPYDLDLHCVGGSVQLPEADTLAKNSGARRAGHGESALLITQKTIKLGKRWKRNEKDVICKL
jgi:hypothetical protein